MKQIAAFTIFLFFSIISSAQIIDSTVEVRLTLLQCVTVKGVNEAALGVSIINHSNKDIYIPCFETYVAFAGIHYYQKEGTEWKEIDIMTHDYYRPFSKTMLKLKGDVTACIAPGFYLSDNDITNYYKGDMFHKKNSYVTNLFNKQDSIIKRYYKENNHPITKYKDFSEDNPLFLKAGQELSNFNVIGIDYLLSKQKEYKIAFNSESRDTGVYHYRDSVLRINTSIQIQFPDHIYEYQLFLPKSFITNVIYYTPLYENILNSRRIPK